MAASHVRGAIVRANPLEHLTQASLTHALLGASLPQAGAI